MNHTPGPWNMRERYIRILDNTDTLDVFAVTANFADDTICEIRQDDANAEENARLICAAPELLYLAKNVVDSQGWDGNNPNEERWIELYAKARAAIAKAEGR